ncbi:hypothetical protein J1614_011709 [Plenodomus biglobosus]|nr:hypothetical protein J1614_011709 [Plenodomus biglobosus]
MYAQKRNLEHPGPDGGARRHPKVTLENVDTRTSKPEGAIVDIGSNFTSMVRKHVALADCQEAYLMAQLEAINQSLKMTRIHRNHLMALIETEHPSSQGLGLGLALALSSSPPCADNHVCTSDAPSVQETDTLTTGAFTSLPTVSQATLHVPATQYPVKVEPMSDDSLASCPWTYAGLHVSETQFEQENGTQIVKSTHLASRDPSPMSGSGSD